MSWAVSEEFQTVPAVTRDSMPLPLAGELVNPKVPPPSVELMENEPAVFTWTSALRIPRAWPRAVVVVVSTPNVVTVWYVSEFV